MVVNFLSHFKVESYLLVDFFALLPFYVSLVLEELEDYQIIGKAGKIIRLMRVIKYPEFTQCNIAINFLQGNENIKSV